jgi:DDB1- and CUL4-associated factor 8
VNVTCAVYNYLGTEILATYSDDDIYLFDNKNYEPGKYLHKYTGHSNSSTIKGVNFFGPESEFIMSGSDCSYIYFWDKETGTIVNWLKGDENGVVNCLEQHPDFPILASSGLDHDVKIWMPSNENPPNLIGLEKKVRRNMQRRKNTRDLECHFDDQIFNLLLNCRQSNIRRRIQNVEGAEGQILSTMDLASDEEEANSTDSDETDRRVSAGVRQIQRVFPCSPS